MTFALFALHAAIMALTRKQKQVLDFVKEFVERKGYSPSLEEIGRRFGLSSVATVHKHVSKLVEKGMLRRQRNVNRSIEPVEQESPSAGSARVPLLGLVAAGEPIEAVEQDETLDVPRSLVPPRSRTYALRVAGNSMIDEQIQDGDYVIVEARQKAENGEVVVALLDGERATVKKFYQEDGKVRLQPANPSVPPILLAEGDVSIRGVVTGVLRNLRRR